MNYDLSLYRPDYVPTFELDMSSDKYEIAVEVNGLFWHSEERGKGRDYHYAKYISAAKAGYKLLQFFEDELRGKAEIVQNIILAKKGSFTQRTFARKTVVETLEYSEASRFLESTHLQGACRQSRVNIGLKYKGELVAVMSFSYNGEVVELSRFASKGLVLGGFSKLLTFFEKNFSGSYSELISFSDNRISDGSVYRNNGFIKVKEVDPDYSWTNGRIRSHKFNFRHSRMKYKLAIYDSSLSESANCRANGYYKIWDAGKVKWKR